MDSHEQNLLAVFESCDDYYQGSLGAAGLRQLCEKLKLQDSYHRLCQYLLEDYKENRFYFQDFKDSLLKLLDSAEIVGKAERDISPGRDIISKSSDKRFGRRSRVDNSETNGFSSDDSNKLQQSQLSCSTDENSSEENVPKKRKTRSKRKERNSLKNSGKCSISPNNSDTSPITNSMNEVEQLVAAWSSVSQGVTDSLSRNELVRVFQCVGLERDSEEAANCVFEKLGFEENGRITLQELLEFIRTGGSWSKEARNLHMELETTQKNASLEFIEPSSLGCITGAYLVEQWECAGVPSALQLLQNLGYSAAQQIDISSIVTLLSEELNNLNDEFKTSNKRRLDPHFALLRANSVLQNIYIQSLKTTIEHLNAEKEKLRNDVIEANQRAMFLAQEVDDHHSKLEYSTQQQVKVMEQKHAEKIREIVNRAKSEQDALVAQNLMLEKKLKSLEEEENKNKSIISQLEMEARLLEQEHRVVLDQLNSVQRAKEKIEKELENASLLQQKVSEMEAVLNETEVVSLLERIRILESENTNLRDRNDELSVEIEELSTKLSNTSTKKRTNPLNPEQSIEDSAGGGAIKRRGDAFLLIESAEDSGGEEGSPRLGKVRKCSHAKDFSETTTCFEELRIHGSGQGDYGSDTCKSDTKFLSPEEVGDCKKENSHQIVPFSKELEQVDGMSVTQPSFQEDFSDDVKEKINKIYQKLQKHDAALTNEIMAILGEIISEKNMKKVKDAEESLKNRCKELESSLELLKEEYEKTEDYWSEKLEEERSLFEEEQKLSDKKYSELLEKIIEYEETLNAEKEQRQRLETIEEKDSFEKQVADMEQECAELRFKLTEALKEKETETEKLKNEIARLKRSQECIECGVQASDVASVENGSREENEENEKPHSKNWMSKQNLKSTPLSCNQCADLKSLFQTKLKCQAELDLIKEEKERLFRQVSERKQKLCNYGGSGKLQELEEKCHTLMVTLRQQQKQTEDILKNTWKQHKAEVKDLKSVLRMTEEKLKRQTKVIQEQLSKLAKTDLLVKDLFVENAYLISSVQKLERQYQSCANNC